MKKLLLLISSLVIGLSNTNAQSSIELSNNSAGGSLITNNSVILEDVAAGAQSHVYVQLKNVSAGTKTYGVRKTDTVVNPGADIYFCWGTQCFPPTTTITPSSEYVTLNSNQTAMQQPFYCDETIAEGYSEVKYEIFDVNNPNDVLTFTIKYNPLLSSVKNNASLFFSVSDVYPNPSASKAHITVNSKVNINNAKVSIMNTLGAVVSVKTTELSVGKNTISLDSENLRTGIYFATISANNAVITKKFTINK